MSLLSDRADSKRAIVTGGSSGFGAAVTAALAGAGWRVVIDGRDAAALDVVAVRTAAVAVAGDVTDPAHRLTLLERTGDRLDLLVNNAGSLGPAPLPAVGDLSTDAVRALLEVNVVAPLALTAAALPRLRAAGGAVVMVTSDAAVAAYRGWGAYGATKAALDRLAAVLAVEEPALAVWSLDPGDLRTRMHQAAFPGEDISDRPHPDEVAPALLRLLERRPPSGRLRAADLLAGVGR